MTAPQFLVVYEYRLPRHHTNHVCNSVEDMKKAPQFYGPAGAYYVEHVRVAVNFCRCRPRTRKRTTTASTTTASNTSHSRAMSPTASTPFCLLSWFCHAHGR